MPNVPKKVTAYVKKADRNYTVKLDEISDQGLNYLLEYGLKQSLSDSVADAKNHAIQNEMALDEAIEVLVEKRYRRIVEGSVGSGGTSGDPVTKHIRQLLAKKVKGWKDLPRAARDEKVAKIRDGGGNDAAQEILAEAQRRADAEASQTPDDLGL